MEINISIPPEYFINRFVPPVAEAPKQPADPVKPEKKKKKDTK